MDELVSAAGKFSWTLRLTISRSDEMRTKPKIETFQDLVLEPRKDGQEMWRWLYTELRSAIIDGR